MGSDDRLAILMALGSGQFRPLGLSTVYGNVSVQTATANACELFTAFGLTEIPVYAGAHEPLNGILPIGDNAYGADGAGGVKLIGADQVRISPTPAPNGAHKELLNAVLSQSGQVTVFATGPLTNIARIVQALASDPASFDAFRKKTKFIIMGGSQKPGPFPNPAHRTGNITEYAEFNMHMDPLAAQVVFDSGLECHLVAMDATQHLDFSPARQSLLKDRIAGVLGGKLVDMIRIVEPLDMEKYGTQGSFMHDPQVVVYAMKPEIYKTIACDIFIEADNPPEGWDPQSRYGKMTILPKENGRVTFTSGITASADEVFALILNNIQKMAQYYSGS